MGSIPIGATTMVYNVTEDYPNERVVLCFCCSPLLLSVAAEDAQEIDEEVDKVEVENQRAE